jgi:hypothetical protein
VRTAALLALAALLAGCGSADAPARPAQGTSTPTPSATQLAAPLKGPEARRQVRRLARGFIADMRAREFPGICRRFAPSDRGWCYQEYRHYKLTSAERRFVATTVPGRIDLHGEFAVIHLDAAGHPDWARIYADRQTAMTATWAIVSKATYQRDVHG